MWCARIRGWSGSMPTNPPTWLPQVSNPKYDEREVGMRLRGSDKNHEYAMDDLFSVLNTMSPPGYRFSKASAGVEHARGRRLTWSVEWVTDEHAEALYARKQLSRFAVRDDERS